MKKLKIIYAGTPEFAVPALNALIESGHEVIAVYTQPDRPAGRGRKVKFGPVKQIAVNEKITVEQPLSLKDEQAQKKLQNYNADVMVVAAYGLILPQVVLDMPKYGCINIHGSLLPRWRGAAPIHRAIEKGDKETGITIMQMAAGLDTGDMLLKVKCPISQTDTVQLIHDCLATSGAEALLGVLDQIQNLKPEKQDDNLTTYAHKVEKSEAEIDWTESAKNIDQKIRAFSGWPVAYTLFNGESLRIHMSKVENVEQSSLGAGTVVSEDKDGVRVATGEGVISFSRLQLPGKKAMDVKDFLNGRSLINCTFPS